VAADKKRFDVDWQQGVFGESGATPFCDGTSVYVWFGAGVTARYSLDGKRDWISFDNFGWCEHGIYASPMLVDGKLITWMDGMTAFDAKSGKRLWHTPMRTGAVWGSVVLCTVAGEKLVTTTDGTFVRVSDGTEVWEHNFFGSHHVPTPIVEDGVIYTYMGTNSYKGFGAIRLPDRVAGGKPKVLYTREDKQWPWADSELSEKDFARSVIATPLYYQGLIYLLSEGGGLRVVEAKSGETVYKKVLDLKPRTAYWNFGGCSASPTLAGKYIYLMDNQGAAIVIEPGRQFKQVARNVIANTPFGKPKEQEVCITTPVFDGKLMLIRGPEYLYCIGAR
jgi:outer membrane protein assembly factor BamB